ncbi:MAG: hypothetical protein JO276_04405 [Sphingomonadaceae bacterium]|nr:hypothetical protein [Sphingomonadaceae bacterium]
MLVYGDRSETRAPRPCLDELAGRLAGVAALPPGLGRHSALVGALILAGRLAQSVADADFAAARADHEGEASAALGMLVQSLAESVLRSWESGFAAAPLPEIPRPRGLPPAADMRLPEGYAFYAVYPEAFAEAARRLRLAGPPRVIGIRSIGTSLAAIVAAALGAPSPATLRPFGDPFDRQVALAPALAADLLALPDAHYVIVDEGPGLSGSSFGAVAAWLEGRGVPAERIAFVTSHDGPPGPQASRANRERWQRTQRVAGEFGERLPRLVAAWAADLLGPLDGPLADLSGGAWRCLHCADESLWPAACAAQERRKLLARARGRTWLIKFAGLGAIATHKLARARALHAAGFAPEPRGLIHGFLVERWHGEARLGGPELPPLGRVALYLGARARLFPATPGSGAGLAELLEMCRRNIGLHLGAAAAARLDRWERQLPSLAPRPRLVETDNRLDRHEWLRLPDGRWLKADALDHHQAHDLVGCQDPAWDVAGAWTEFPLRGRRAAAVAAATGAAAGRRIDPGLLRFFAIAYPAFRLGQAVLAASGEAPAEAARLRAKAESYARALEHRLHSSR